MEYLTLYKKTLEIPSGITGAELKRILNREHLAFPHPKKGKEVSDRSISDACHHALMMEKVKEGKLKRVER